MANQFKIRQRISTSDKGRELRQQITVEFNGRIVTRHIKDGIGRHPDDSLPAYYRKLEERVTENQRLQQNKLEAITILQKFTKEKPKGLDDIMRKATVEVLTGMTAQKAVELAAKMELERQQLVDQLQVLIVALEVVRKEDPLMVTYV